MHIPNDARFFQSQFIYSTTYEEISNSKIKLNSKIDCDMSIMSTLHDNDKMTMNSLIRHEFGNGRPITPLRSIKQWLLKSYDYKYIKERQSSSFMSLN